MAQKPERSPCMIPSNVSSRPLNSGTRIKLDYYPFKSLIDLHPFLRSIFGLRDSSYYFGEVPPVRWDKQNDHISYYFTLPELYESFSYISIDDLVHFLKLHLADVLGNPELDEFGESILLLEQIRNLNKVKQAEFYYSQYQPDRHKPPFVKYYLRPIANITEQELETIVQGFPEGLKDKRRSYSPTSKTPLKRLERRIRDLFLLLNPPILLGTKRKIPSGL